MRGGGGKRGGGEGRRGELARLANQHKDQGAGPSWPKWRPVVYPRPELGFCLNSAGELQGDNSGADAAEAEGVVDLVVTAAARADHTGGVAHVDHARVFPVGVRVEPGGVAERGARQGSEGRAR